MAIAIINGSVMVRIKVDYTEASLATLTTLIGSSPGAYSEKVFKTLDDGEYYYVDAQDVISAPGANLLDAGKAASDGPVDLTSGAVTYPTLTANVNDLDPTGSGSDGVSILNVSNNSGAMRQITGIVAPTTSKTMVIYNDGPDTVRLRDQNANAIAANRFDVGGNINITDKTGLWLIYDTVTQRWRAL